MSAMCQDATADPSATIAELRRERDAALARETALAEVLQVINSSPGDLAPVFEAILEKATRLCEAACGQIATYDGEQFRWVAVHGDAPFVAEQLAREPMPPSFGVTWPRIVGGEGVVNIADLKDTDLYRAGHESARSGADVGGARSLLSIALRKEDVLRGILTVYRQELRPFTDRETALLQSFAAQAVIAMENARLLTETREALDQQTATAEVLGVINSSPGDLAPVFDAMLDKAMRLCGVDHAALELYDGERFRAVAVHGASDRFAEMLRQGYRAADSPASRTLLEGGRFVQIADAAQIDLFTFRAAAELDGIRTVLFVPLRRDDALLGMIASARREVRLFSDKEIALLENFAAQAVIAMENARLLTETREALAQQTATAGVLGVINSSPGDLAPVFDAMLEKATELCDAAFGILWIRAGTRFRPAALHGVPPAFVEYLASEPTHPAEPGTGLGRIAEGDAFVHLIDPASTEAYRTSSSILRRAFVDLGGTRTLLTVALRKHGALLGALSIYRKEIRAFSDQQIALVTSFAAQAVIAMENARLLNELQERTHDLEESLEYQTATSDVLQVISRSTFDLQPVLDTLVETAARLCGADGSGIAMREGEVYRYVALHATYGISEYLTFMRQRTFAPGRDTTIGRVALEGKVVHIADIAADPEYALSQSSSMGRIRTNLGVPLLRDGAVIGMLTVFRQRVELFSERQIELVRTFADQAVIAIENARLLTETREALEQQTATAEVLQVINSSPGDLAPVFDAMLAKAHSLCGVAYGSLHIYDGERFRAAATHNLPAEFVNLLQQGFRGADNPVSRPLLDGARLVHIPDLAEIDDPTARAAFELGGIRTALFLPMRKDGALLGMIVSARREVRLFAEKEIALLQTFAAQAVIAMENARLLTETREALAQQTATAEVLGVINSSPGELAPVFDAMLERAMRLCQAEFGEIFVTDGGQLRSVAVRGTPPAFAEFRRLNPVPPTPGGITARVLGGERVIHIADVRDDDFYRRGDPHRRALVDLGGARTYLSATLLNDREPLGTINIYRQEVRPVSDKQVALLQNFAAQAVIAMENARLLTETREALDQQTATAEVLRVINASPGDLAPVFQAMLQKAHTLCQASFGALMTYDGERFHPVAHQGTPAPFREFLAAGIRPGPDDPFGRMVQGAALSHIDDLSEVAARYPGEPLPRASVDLGGIRTLLVVPLRKDSALLGVITAYRQEVRPFTDKQTALLQNFAAQAVIAMENARLITETREALEQQTATAEVLQVINSSPGNVAPVFEAMLEKATRLCDASLGTLWAYDGERMHPMAMRGVTPEYAQYLSNEPLRPGAGALGSFVRGETILHVVDLKDTEAYRNGDIHRRALVDLGGGRSLLGVPLRTDDQLRGAFLIYRREPQPFTDKQIALLENFAAQAVIAMENARLITETREALEYQTAVGDVLKVISGSAFDLGPVLQTVVSTAIRLCRADQAVIYRNFDGEYRWAAGQSLAPEYERIEREARIRPGPGTLVGRAAAEARTVHMLDAWTDPLYEAKDNARVGGAHTMLGVPLLRDGAPIGVIGLARCRIEAYSDKEIELVRTFADQAVIAIENARLFNELRARTAELGQSVGELRLLSEVGQAVSSTLDLRAVLSTILTRSVGLTGADAGAVFRYNRAERAFRLVEAAGLDDGFAGAMRDVSVAEAETAMSEAAARRAPVQLTDLAQRPKTPLVEASLAAGLRSALIVPLVGPERILGALVLQRRMAGEFPAETVRLMQTLASQSVLAIQNARLFREIAEKSEQLALASEHKSQFLANMSHELRTPLNAILGYAELLVDGIYGVLPEKAQGVLERVQNNGKHLLALINDVLDLAKIEAGQLALTIEDYSLPELVKTVVVATEPLAAAKGLKFTAAVEGGMPRGHGDARRLAQVLLNLVGNAIKFTDAGEVEIRAALVTGQFVLTVRDTGPGIADADQDRIFGEFQQIDNADTRKKGGTGLGLAISKRMVEMQGGMITVESVLGQGSTFRVVMPVEVEPALEDAAE